MSVRRVVHFSLGVQGVLFMVLVGTGLWLSLYYRPTGRQHEQAARYIHGLASTAFAWVAVWIVALVLIDLKRERRRRLRWDAPWAFGAVVIALATSFTGFLLPWDQLALRAVTVGVNFAGLWRASFDSGIRFVLIDAREISQGTLRGWFLVHAFPLPLLMITATAMLLRGPRSRPTSPAVGELQE